MEYRKEIEINQSDPASLENLYRQAVRENHTDEFSQEMLRMYRDEPTNQLFAAWYFRLKAAAEEVRVVLWRYAVPLAIFCGLLIWVLSAENLVIGNGIPLFIMVWAPIEAVAVMAFMTIVQNKNYKKALALGAGLVALTVYVLLMVPTMEDWSQEPAAILMAIHLPVVSLSAVGAYITGVKSTPERRFAFIIKTLEVITTGGLFAIAIGIFSMVTTGLFSALDIFIGDVYLRLILVGGGGFVPVIAVAFIYNPTTEPEEQDFNQGLSKFLANLLRIMIIPTLLVAMLYVFFIPFNFMEPFYNRDVLFIYNGMLFAVIGLLIGATPIEPKELSQRLQTWLRYVIMAVATLAVLVSLYALAAIIYRTWMEGITMNRLTVIGWNFINITVLGTLLYNQFSSPEEEWGQALKESFNLATYAYTAWGILIILGVPLLFS